MMGACDRCGRHRYLETRAFSGAWSGLCAECSPGVIRVDRHINADGDTIYTVNLPRNRGNVSKGSGYNRAALIAWARRWAPNARVRSS